MKGYLANVGKCILAIILVFFPALVLAQSEVVPSSPLWDMFYNLSFTPPTDDISVAVLAKMFGTVPGVPQFAGAGTTVIGVIFSVFNAGVLAISGVFLSYTITRVVTETTMDGAAIGKNTTIWTAVRCALSTSLLVPQPSGYSLVNGIVMWVVIQGIGLADLTWNRALDFLEQGGTTLASPTAQINYSLVNWDEPIVEQTSEPTPKSVKAGSADVLRSLTCAHMVHAALTSRQKETYNYLLNEQATRDLAPAEMQEFVQASTPIPEMGEDFAIYKNIDTAKTYTFPFISSDALFNYGLGINNIATALAELNTGLCGTISYGVSKSATAAKSYKASKSSTNYDEYVTSKKNGLDSMISMLEPVAKQLVDKIQMGSDGQPAELDPVEYEVYIDDEKTPHGFVYDAKKKFISGKSNFNSNALTSNELDAGGFTPGSELSQKNISYPFGTEALLAAAAEYQYAVADAMKTSQENLGAYTAARFAKAREDGWVGAGTYYRLLTQTQKAALVEYDHYRLTGYETPYSPFPDDVQNDPNAVRDSNPGSSTLMRATKYGYNISGVNPIGVVSQAHKTALEKAMQWIYYTYPYAKIYSKAFAANVEQLENISLKGVNIPMIYTVKVFITLAKIGTYVAIAMGAMLIAIAPPAGLIILLPIPLMFLVQDVALVAITWADVMGPDPIMGVKDPIIKLQYLGESMIANSLLYVTEIMAFSTAVLMALTVASLGYQVIGAAAMASLLANAISQFVNMSIQQITTMVAALQTVLFVSVPFGLAVFIPMFVSGVMFAVYVPLIPYMLYLFGVISWLISVLILMAAAPIICFLMLWGNSSQENPLLAREAETFLMQIIGAFFRPTLMVIGLVAGVVLSYIAVDLLNRGFYVIVIDTILSANWSAPGAAIVSSVVKLVGMVVIYTTIMVTLVNMCFSPIYLLYSEAMRVVGVTAPATGMEAQQLEAVKGAFVQAVGEVGAGIKETAGGYAQKASSTGFQGGQAGGGGAGAEGGSEETAEAAETAAMAA